MDPGAYDDFLQSLPDDRQAAVKSWLGSTLKDCAVCVRPIRVMDSHRLVQAGLVHTECALADA